MPPSSRAQLHDCWNRIGVRGDSSCPELERHIHCRNCPVYAGAAAVLLDGAIPDDTTAEWTRHIAETKLPQEQDTRSVVIFRIGMEWLALPTGVFVEVADLCAIHSLPHRRNGVVLGLGNVRGELLICVSLGSVLGLDLQGETAPPPRTAARRLLVVQHEGRRLIFPVDEVHGIHRFSPRVLQDVPATAVRAGAGYCTAILPWNGKSVGCLDEPALFHTLNRSLA
ncbi:chemotaxis protein CheW [Pseudogulbenkiania sp. MAI-1]|uniref:chemotaxis protein CheW n=1 Tax=Pseudogulbenkiania sp. MAI-1 TaxID=990370 RepID=UPI0004A2ECC6|nr:chemotaxis protein CheW [Pseudogulbenkiania sp. MAI-1]